jgi:hypothetical protein
MDRVPNLLDIINIDSGDNSTEPYIKKSEYFNLQELADQLKKLTMSKYLSILNTNARSLVKHISEFQLLFNCLSSQHAKLFDVLSFTETWLDKSSETLVTIDNYDAIFKHKNGSKKGGGLAIYVQRGLKFSIRKDLVVPENKQHMFDCLFIEQNPRQKCSFWSGLQIPQFQF